MSPSPLADFLRAYWEEMVIAAVMILLAILLVIAKLENDVLKATLKNAKTTISNYEDAAKANLATIDQLKAKNKSWADQARRSTELAAEQAKIIESKEKAFAAKESTLLEQLEKAHAANQSYSAGIVPAAVTRRLRENSRQD